ncbi:LacI family DNA-binding transcriptional regulator [Paenibacillus sp. HW567]|uniref:LacI family DNA-binding transcriptional regulator n=1 Tax=Paenibacillus sp. HW567 TaxID=1034769 RepID=UPI00036C0327|nr:LacI family DNA-binding transcriptional regulator [Paenibacillus sp. HW567]
MTYNIKDIAKIAGVSVSTVSKIINNYSDISEDTRTRVLQIIKETGYNPSNSAKTLATKSSSLIGVIFAGMLNVDFTHPFFIEVLNSFKKQMGLLGYDLLFFSNEKFPSGDNNDYLARCQHYNVDGCVLISGQELEASISQLDNSSIPCIGVDMKLSGRNSGYIMSDNYKMSSKVVEHFYLLGYRELGYIGSTLESDISNMRESGYRKAIEDLGLQINESWFLNGENFFEASGYETMRRMIAAGPLPRAIFAASDQLAIGALRALKEAAIPVPGTLALIGCDDIEACHYTTPPLSTIRQNKEKIGRLAALMLYDLINSQSGASSFIVEPELIVRESCGAAKPGLDSHF